MEESKPKSQTQPTVNGIPPKDNTEQKSGQPPVEPPLPSNVVPAPENERETYHCRPDQTPVAKIILEVVAVAVGCAYTVAAFQQLSAMRGQLREIIKQYPEIQKSSNAAKSAAETADATLKSAQQQFRVEHRPYLSAEAQGCFTAKDPNVIPRNAITVPGADGGSQFCVAAIITNSGHSPAIEVDSTPTLYKLGPREKVRQEVRSYKPNYEGGHATTIVTVGGGITPINGMQYISKDTLTLLDNRSWEIYVVGAVRYHDMFMPKIDFYETTYCWQLIQTGNPFHECDFPPPARGNSIK